MTLQKPREPFSPTTPPQAEPYPWRVGIGILVAILIGAGLLAFAMGIIRTPLQSSNPEAAGQAPQAVTTTIPLSQPVAAAQVEQPTTVSISATSLPTSSAIAGSEPASVTRSSAGEAASVPDGPTTVASSGTEPTAGQPEATLVSVVLPSGTPETVSSTVANTDPDTVAAVLNGYLRYWETRVLITRDPGRTDLDLSSTMAGTELARAQQVAATWAQQGNAYEMNVQHQLILQALSSGQASVFDDYTATSRKLDLGTQQPTATEPIIEHSQVTFTLLNIDGTWKVADENGAD